MSSPAPCLHRLLTLVAPARLGRIPFWRLAGMYAGEEHCVLLDSALQDECLGRWSFLAARPAAVMTVRRQPAGTTGPAPAAIRIERFRRPDGGRPGPVTETVGDPFEAIRGLLREYWPDGWTPADAPPMAGGLVGAIGYEAGRCLEVLPGRAHDDLELPDVALMAADEVLACEHASGRVTLCVTGRGPDPDAAERDALDRQGRCLRELDDFVAARRSLETTAEASAPDAEPARLGHHFDRDAYRAAVQRCREHILAGDVFEVCLTRRIEAPAPASGWSLYAELRKTNPAPFAAWLRFPGWEAVSASPERFLSLDRSGRAESRPIKGTRPRGATPEQDESLRRELAASEKDLAENLMIVDLVRSDLGRVAEIGSVGVPQLQIVETYATVHQLVSTVRARLRPGLDAVDLLRACFPGGSMTGAPKIEAMKIIDAIEPVARGIYSGAIGYLDAGGGADLSIVIRTIVLAGGRATLGVGGAVTADSDPDAEFEETRDKARALLRALAAVALRDGKSGNLPAPPSQ